LSILHPSPSSSPWKLSILGSPCLEKQSTRAQTKHQCVPEH